MSKSYTVLRCNTEHYEHSSFFFSAVALENMVVTKDDGEWYETVVSVVSATWW